jgi:hypothetical protein
VIAPQPASFHDSTEARKWPSKMCQTFTYLSTGRGR